VHIFQGIKSDTEVSWLLTGALLTSALLLFILLEPFFTQSLTTNKSTYRISLQTTLPDQNASKLAAKTQIESDKIVAPNKEDLSLKKTESSLRVPTPPFPELFSFGVQPNIEKPTSVPFLGGARSGMRPQNSNPQAPKPSYDSASNEARWEANFQFGNELNRQQAQSEIPVFINSLESNERYQCIIEFGSQAKCQPQNGKSKNLESIMIRFYGNTQCIQIELSKEMAIQSAECK
jgi:hypothetical protein